MYAFHIFQGIIKKCRVALIKGSLKDLAKYYDTGKQMRLRIEYYKWLDNSIGTESFQHIQSS